MAIRGSAQAQRKLTRTLQKVIPEKAGAAMHVVTSIISGHATLMTPMDEGNLARSQYASVDQSGDTVTARIGYTAIYAESVHEAKGTLKGQPRSKTDASRGDFWDPSGEPHFLQKAGDDHADEIDKAVKKAMKL